MSKTVFPRSHAFNQEVKFSSWTLIDGMAGSGKEGGTITYRDIELTNVGRE